MELTGGVVVYTVTQDVVAVTETSAPFVTFRDAIREIGRANVEINTYIKWNALVIATQSDQSILECKQVKINAPWSNSTEQRK